MNAIDYEQYHETKTHGRASFAYNTYLCTIPQDFARVPLHWHNEVEIIAVKKGGGTVRVDLTPYEAEAGCLVFVMPGQLHDIEGAPGVRMEYENIIFSLDLLDTGDDWCRRQCLAPLRTGALRPPTLLRPGMPQYAAAAACVDGADAVCAARSPGYPLLVKAQMLRLLQLWYESAQEAQTQAAPLERQVKLALRYVEEHCAEPITIAQMARVCCCSEAHFMRFFKAAMGVTFVEYCNGYRLAAAVRALSETDASVLEVAQGAGFENISYFNRCFRRKYGMTPTALRRGARRGREGS